MFITEMKKEGIKILELNGRIDATADNFESELKEMTGNELKILVDCGNLNYINSAGLRIFLSTMKDVTKKQGKLIITNLQENIKEIFRISGFLQLFEVYDTRDEALKHFLL